MITMVLCGLGLGIGMWLLAVWAFPPRPSLQSLMATLNQDDTPWPVPTMEAGGQVQRLAHQLARRLRAVRLPSAQLRGDLVVVGHTIEQHIAEKVILTAIGAVLPSAVNLMLFLIGADMAWYIPAVAGLVLACVGFMAPDLNVHHEAQRRRAAFRHGLSAYLNLVRVLLAGGAGVDGALSDAASVGRGYAFTQLRQALATAKITRTTPWSALAELGAELDVRELTELASSITLAGTEGARIRASLAAKAAAIRTYELADAEATAQSATERMSLPVGLLFAGFLILIAYPALAAVLAGF